MKRRKKNKNQREKSQGLAEKCRDGKDRTMQRDEIRQSWYKEKAE